MSTLHDAWGSPGYVLLTGLCHQAAEYHEAYEQRGCLPDLVRAITGFSGVLAVAVNVDVRSTAANGLGLAFWSRYERFGRPGDLDHAIALFRTALAMYPDEKTPSVPAFQPNLAGVLHLRWTRTRSKDDLTEAMKAARAAALAATPARHSLHPRFQSNLALALLDRFQAGNRPADLAEATRLAQDAARATPADHPNRAERLGTLSQIRQVNLTGALQRRGRRKARRALNQMIRSAVDAVAAVPSDHIAWAAALFRQGWALSVKAAADNDATAYDRAIACYQQLAHNTAAPVSVRVAAGWRWAVSEIRSRIPGQAYDAARAGGALRLEAV